MPCVTDYSRARSIKTRIETLLYHTIESIKYTYSRARSIKTRIETIHLQPGRGLIQDSRARSIKTRIETEKYVSRNPSQRIREQDPLKQGLKPSVYGLSLCFLITIREQDPLKQGLKHITHDTTIPPAAKNSRARSIKTRIETGHCQIAG